MRFSVSVLQTYCKIRVKLNPTVYDLLLKGTAIRVYLLNQYGLNQNAEKIKTKYAELKMDFVPLLNMEDCTLDEYVR